MTSTIDAKILALRCGFNSATASPPWMTRKARARRLEPSSSFNSATASPPWMTRSDRANCRSQQLQFGHSVAAVDDVRRPTRLGRRRQLQFGHSVAAVDDPRQWSKSGPRNASIRPQRRRRGSRYPGAESPWEWVLQFGHSVAAVDDKDNSCTAEVKANGCFNSATASPPWMTWQTVMRLDGPRFNSATASPPWMTVVAEPP